MRDYLFATVLERGYKEESQPIRNQGPALENKKLLRMLLDHLNPLVPEVVVP